MRGRRIDRLRHFELGVFLLHFSLPHEFRLAAAPRIEASCDER